MADSVNEQWQDRIITNAVDVLRFEPTVRRIILGHLHLLEQDLVRQIERMDIDGVSRQSYKFARAEKLIKQTRDTISSRYRAARKDLTSNMRDLGVQQSEALMAIGRDVFQADILSVAMTPRELRVLASNVMIDGNPAKDWWARQDSGLRTNFAREIRLGTMAGETNQQLVQRVRGTQSGRKVLTIDGKRRVVPSFKGGIMDTSTRQATSLVRTATQSVSNEVLEQTYKANSDIIHAVEAVATLDGRTTIVCISRSGALWDIMTGVPLPESPVDEPYPGRPPWHFQCRTVLSPYTKSWDQLIEEAGGKPTGKLGKIPLATRASMDGQVPGTLTYEEWLKTKSKRFQRDVLGRGRWELWDAGKIKAKDLLDTSGRPLTLKQLRARYAA